MKVDFFHNIITADELNGAKRLIEGASRVVITCHTAPDGDAIGSSLGMKHVLDATGRETRVVVPDPVPSHLRFLPGADSVVVNTRNCAEAGRLIAEADLIICQDFNELKRTDSLAQVLESATAPKLLIDHHLHPDTFARVTVSHPEVSSTSMLVYRLLQRLGISDKIGLEAAECICTGMMTDTGNFSYNANDPDLYLALADLMRIGVDKDRIYTLAMNTHSENSIRLNSYALDRKMEVFCKHRAALITLTRPELNRYHYQRGDTEGLVNKPLAIPGVVYSVYLRDEDGYVKVSCRSKGEFPVNKMCNKYFNGGGHLNAAGGEFIGTMAECLVQLKRAMADFDQYLPVND